MKQAGLFARPPCFILLLLLLVSPLIIIAQPKSIKLLEGRLKKGDKDAFYELAEYLDSSRNIRCLIGCQIETLPISRFAQLALERRLLLTEAEPNIYELSSEEFISFIKLNEHEIVFSDLAGAFLRTPLEDREIYSEATKISEIRKKYLEKRRVELLSLNWIVKANVDSLYFSGDSRALLQLASYCYKHRDDDESNIDGGDYADLVSIFTGCDLSVGLDSTSLNKQNDFLGLSNELEFLIYFSKFYKNYSWNKANGVFENRLITLKPLDPVKILFEVLFSDEDSLSALAYIKLTESEPEKVQQFNKEFNLNYRSNFKFLYPLSLLTQYCKENKFEYKGSIGLQSCIQRLRIKMTFAERRILEDSLIKAITLDEVTALEYWTLVYEDQAYLTYSTARILDIYYSRNWNNIIASSEQLKLYLKKSYLFDNMGIVGSCRNYLKKFTNATLATLSSLETLSTPDNDIKYQIERIKALRMYKTSVVNKSYSESTYKYHVDDLEKKINSLLPYYKKMKTSDDFGALFQLLSKIGYHQIGAAIKKLEEIESVRDHDKYSFIETDWGFLDVNLTNKEMRNEFLNKYSELTELGLYAFYLDKAGIVYKDSFGGLDYDRIYSHIKYDRVTPFIGGGMTTYQEVYSLIKLLEITFKNNLGFNSKLCSSGGFHYCDLRERSKAWLQFMDNKNLLKLNHTEPPSFND